MRRGIAVAACAVVTAMAIVAASPLAACAAAAKSGQMVMGTILSVTVISDDSDRARELADAAIEEARRWDDALTIWRPEGELARLNANAGRGEVAIGPRLANGLAAMLEFSQRTGGAFDPAVGALWVNGPRPAAPVEAIGRVLRLGGSRAALNEGSALDPGAIGKGLALDAMVAMLAAAGVRSAFLDFGGSSQTAIGVPPGDAGGWPVVVAGSAPGVSHGVVKLRDASLSTSRAGAGDTTPILDPRSGAAVPSPRLATVLATNATSADAWSTALVVAGRDGLATATANGIEVLFEDAGGVVRTAGFVTGALRNPEERPR